MSHAILRLFPRVNFEDFNTFSMYGFPTVLHTRTSTFHFAMTCTTVTDRSLVSRMETLFSSRLIVPNHIAFEILTKDSQSNWESSSKTLCYMYPHPPGKPTTLYPSQIRSLGCPAG